LQVNSDGTTYLEQRTVKKYTASMFGWYHRCKNTGLVHGRTDGTVDCPVCGKKASVMIVEASEFLDEHIGDTVEDIGYFEEDNNG
jgi:hypothetical protein